MELTDNFEIVIDIKYKNPIERNNRIDEIKCILDDIKIGINPKDYNPILLVDELNLLLNLIQ